MNIGQFLRENTCLGNRDPDHNCHELNKEKVFDEFDDFMTKGGVVIEHYVTNLFPECWFDSVFMLHTESTQS